MTNWYEASTGTDQGLIVEEKTGENIAVCYDKANAALIAAAPELLEALKVAERRTKELCNTINILSPKKVRAIDWIEDIVSAIAKATGED